MYQSQPPEEQRRLLDTVALNYTFDGVTATPTYRKPFDLLAKGLTLEKWRTQRDKVTTFLCSIDDDQAQRIQQLERLVT